MGAVSDCELKVEAGLSIAHYRPSKAQQTTIVWSGQEKGQGSRQCRHRREYRRDPVRLDSCTCICITKHESSHLVALSAQSFRCCITDTSAICADFESIHLDSGVIADLRAQRPRVDCTKRTVTRDSRTHPDRRSYPCCSRGVLPCYYRHPSRSGSS